jgi:hypothetical protein
MATAGIVLSIIGLLTAIIFSILVYMETFA